MKVYGRKNSIKEIKSRDLEHIKSLEFDNCYISTLMIKAYTDSTLEIMEHLVEKYPDAYIDYPSLLKKVFTIEKGSQKFRFVVDLCLTKMRKVDVLFDICSYGDYGALEYVLKRYGNMDFSDKDLYTSLISSMYKDPSSFYQKLKLLGSYIEGTPVISDAIFLEMMYEGELDDMKKIFKKVKERKLVLKNVDSLLNYKPCGCVYTELIKEIIDWFNKRCATNVH